MCALIVVGVFWASFPVQAAKGRIGLFSYRETPHQGLEPFPKWTGVLEKYFKLAEKNKCTSGAFNECSYAKWGKMLSAAQKLAPMDQLKAVNTFMNSHRYIVDSVNWGVDDYWAVPDEFMKKFGDCEDYSIAKYMSLRALGWKPEAMRVVVLKDLNLKAMHAILAVSLNNKQYILDNQISKVVEHNRIRHYQPIFSVSETGWWRHKKAKKKSGLKKIAIKKKSSLAKVPIKK